MYFIKAIFNISKSMEQRSCIKFCVKNAINGTQTFEMLRKTFGDKTLIGIGCLKNVVNLLKMIIVLGGHQHQTTMKTFEKSKIQYWKIAI